jgi:murein DD-endopeptidase MepM/ murein hydrolase activator NlpD
VTHVVTGVPDNPIGVTPYPPAIATGGGNEVLVYLGDGIFTMYGHLVPGSVSLRVGDRVRRGDVIGKLGNTGQSTVPHLHFQVMDDSSIAASQGLPWVFDKFVLVATFDELDDSGAVIGITPITSPRRGELPLQQTLIRFP